MCNFYKSTFTLEEFRKNLETLHERLRKPFIYRLALIKVYEGYIDENCNNIERYKANLIWKLNNGYEGCAQSNAKNIYEKRNENRLFEMFIESLKYAKTGERK